ncbi:MAG: type II CRISPR RNA-guided endonuclease Cas9 [Nitrosomonadaceae bacterium]|nr:type II CRISPR RNA-guided endonuclease Cas9 [Nitrosomonadaceae bacterium]
MTSKQENLGALTFGLDIGIASVGWTVLGENRIIDLGVRCFDKAETAKEGESLNLARRSARLLRRRLRRRAWRLIKLARLLKREGVIVDANLFKCKIEKNTPVPKSSWQLRVDALDRQLTAEEWARVIYHLCKHRGFHWISRAEEKAAEGDSKSEGGKVKQGLAGTKKLMADKSYRTAAEMVLAEFPEAQRNKQGDYSKALSRILLGDELKVLFEHQRKLGNPFASEKLETTVLGDGDKKSGLFWAQNPALAGNKLLEMLGRCTFEKTGGDDGKGEYRAPKASFSAERHVWLTRLNNLRIVVDGTTRSLNEAERRVALPMPYQQAGDFTYKQLRTALTKANYLPDSFRYTGLSYASGQKADEKTKDPEAAALVKLPAWQELRKTLKDAGLENEWQKISTDALEGRPQLLDQIAWVLSVYKDDDEVTVELSKLDLPNAEKMIDALLDIRFDKFSNLSLKALHQIVPRMEQGQRYDEAIANIPEYGHHSQLHKAGKGEHKYLPPFYKERDKTGRMVFIDDMDIPRNPVVLRALNQARKVVNALIKKYGSPHEVHIEMARDLSRPLDERRDIEKLQKEFRDNNEKGKVQFAQDFNIVGAVKGKEFEKYQLYREQQSKCAYSIEPIDIHRLFEQGYVEIDHALPYSRSFDDSKNNRVLVLAKENRDKGNRTPFEYLGGKDNSEPWRQFVAFVEGNKAYRLAKRSRLLRKDFDEKEAKEFRERNLNDTRYICKFFKNYVEQYLQLHEDSEAKRCVVLSGQMTSFLRARWGLVKVRGDSDRHHALDAAVVAACSHGMVKRLSDYSRRKELEQVREGFVDVTTGEIPNPTMFDQLEQHFPNPWQHFRNELEARLKLDDPALLREEMQRLGTYSEDALETLHPLFVSRAPQRRNSGAAHKDTIYAQPERLKAQGGVTQKVALSSLTLKDLDKLIDPYRNEKLYAAIRTRLEQHSGKGDKAFPSSNPLRKPDSEGNPTGPIVRGVTMVIDKLSGIPIRGGIAKNDSMVRVDVFTKDNKFHLVPVYVYHTVAKALPNRAVVAFKDEDEWTLIDDSFEFYFSMYPNDLIHTKLKGESYWGYFSGCDRATGAIGLWAQDRSKLAGKDGFYRVGVKMALSIEKFNVDVLGNRYPAPPEKRRDLA